MISVLNLSAVLLSAGIHSASLGSGSRSPFPIELEPVSTSPGGQMKVIVLPLTAGSL